MFRMVATLFRALFGLNRQKKTLDNRNKFDGVVPILTSFFTDFQEILDISPVKQFLSEEVFEKMFELFFDTSFQNLIHEWEISNVLKESIRLETVSYFMKRKVLERLKKDQLLPEDIARLACKTVGIVEHSFCAVRVIDAGGQRSERRKWSNLLAFPNSKICLMVSLAEFDEFCYEDGNTSRFDESFNLLQNLLDLKYIKKIYLVFTKYDLLRKKISGGIKFSIFNVNFKGDDTNANQVKDFIIETFLKLDVNKKIVKHFTIDCSFDREQIVEVFNTILERKAFDSAVDPNYTRDEMLVEKWLNKSYPGWKVIVPTTTKTTMYGTIDIEPEEAIEKWTARALNKDELLTVSEFLDFDTISNMRLTCKEWSDILLEIGIHLRRPNIDLFMKTGFKHVKSLNLQACYLTRDNLKYLAENRFKSLEYLNLSNNYNFSEDDFSNLFKNEFPNLKYLILDYCNFTNISILRKSAFINQLKVLSLNGNDKLNKDDLHKIFY